MKPDKVRKFALYFSVFMAVVLIVLMALDFPGYVYTFPLHGFLVAMPFYFLYKTDFKAMLKELGIPCQVKTLVVYAIAGFAVSFIVSTLITPLLASFGINDWGLVAEKVLEAPPSLAMLLFIVPPVSEELFFRGFLMRRLGILGSTIIFGLAHFFYGSLANIIFAFFIGLVYAYVYKKSGSLLPGIAAHAAYNFLAVIAILGRG